MPPTARLALLLLPAAACGGSATYDCPSLHYRATGMGGEAPYQAELETDEGIVATVSAATDHPFQAAELCIHRSTELPGVVAVAGRSGDDCLSLGFVYGRRYYADVAGDSTAALGTLGWPDAAAERRGRLARAWVEEVMMREGRFVDEPERPGDFGGRYPEFVAPRAESLPGGGLAIEGYVEVPGRGGDRRYELRRYEFSSDGTVTATSALTCFAASD